ILPLPSSPHWAPTITMFGMGRLVEDGLGLGDAEGRRLGVERVAALPAELRELACVEREEPALREATVVDPAGVLAVGIRGQAGAAEEDLAAGAAAVALPLAAGEQGVRVLGLQLGLHQAPHLAAPLPPPQPPIPP